MDETTEWESEYNAEIQQAEAARSAGNEGMARVCARRAAGAVIGEYMLRRGLPNPGSGAYDRIRCLTDLPDAPAEARQVAAHLLLRVTPEYRLPIEADLIAEARWLKETLLRIPRPPTLDI
ncbi:MAG: hypothetical protein JXA78_16000 [Anaerolineales bacterium]|nr:hypothetical protein [Anaerolineales bacterium]